MERIQSVVEKVSDEESEEYFHSRPLDSHIGALASPHSQAISGCRVLAASAANTRRPVSAPTTPPAALARHPAQGQHVGLLAWAQEPIA